MVEMRTLTHLNLHGYKDAVPMGRRFYPEIRQDASFTPSTHISSVLPCHITLWFRGILASRSLFCQKQNIKTKTIEINSLGFV
jgi:hypothetical protein